MLRGNISPHLPPDHGTLLSRKPPRSRCYRCPSRTDIQSWLLVREGLQPRFRQRGFRWIWTCWRQTSDHKRRAYGGRRDFNRSGGAHPCGRRSAWLCGKETSMAARQSVPGLYGPAISHNWLRRRSCDGRVSLTPLRRFVGWWIGLAGRNDDWCHMAKFFATETVEDLITKICQFKQLQVVCDVVSLTLIIWSDGRQSSHIWIRSSGGVPRSEACFGGPGGKLGTLGGLTGGWRCWPCPWGGD